MSLFRKKRTRTPTVAAFVAGSVVTLAAVLFGVQRLLRAKAAPKREETDFSDPYIPAGMKRGSRRSVHARV